MLLRLFDLFGVAVFAISGALAGIAAQLDLLGILVLASVTEWVAARSATCC